MSNLLHFTQKLSPSPDSPTKSKIGKQIFFTPEEFRLILAAYSNQVAKGFWRDYAIDTTKEFACFYIYRHSFEHFHLALSKRKNGKNWEFILRSQKRIIKRSNDLQKILSLLKQPLKLA